MYKKKRTLNFIEYYESSGDLKFEKTDRSRNQMLKPEFKLEENQDVDQVYETPNIGTMLEPISLRMEEWLTWHPVSSIRVRVRKEIWTGSYKDILVTKGDF